MSGGKAFPDLLIVSDFHLSEGLDPDTGKVHPNEDFFADEAFCRFLKHYGARAQDEGRALRLLIAGDLFDFLQVVTPPEPGSDVFTNEPRETLYGLGTLPEQTIWKLESKIVPGHKPFFEALRGFLGDGHEVVVLPGNHDIELMDEEVQAALRKELLCSGRTGTAPSGAVKFLPWFYLEPGLVFVEHGHQYDPLNSFNYLLYPKRDDGTFELPAGSFFVRYLFNRVESDHPFADNMKPAARFLRWYLRRHWYHVRVLGRYLAAIHELLKKANPIDPSQASVARAEQEVRLERTATDNGVDTDRLRTLVARWAPSILHSQRPSVKLLRQMKLLAQFCRRTKELRLKELAEGVPDLLGVKYVVFGHTHRAELDRIGRPGADRATYLNTGTWTRCFAETYTDALLESANEFVFCHYDRGAEKMELMRWNDSRGEPEAVRLFEKRTIQGSGRTRGKDAGVSSAVSGAP